MSKHFQRTMLVALILLVILALFGCGNRITEGEVYKKEFRPAYTITRLMPVIVSSGKTFITVMIPYRYHYPDRWVIYIKDYDGEKAEWVYEDFFVSNEVYEAVEIGDIFEFKEDMGSYDEPYTRERQ